MITNVNSEYNDFNYILFSYQYQRWLYPTDLKRIDDGTNEIHDASENINEKNSSKKNK